MSEPRLPFDRAPPPRRDELAPRSPAPPIPAAAAPQSAGPLRDVLPAEALRYGILTGSRIDKYGNDLLIAVDGGVRVCIRCGDSFWQLGAWYQSAGFAMAALDRERKSFAERTRR